MQLVGKQAGHTWLAKKTASTILRSSLFGFWVCKARDVRLAKNDFGSVFVSVW